jgi:hypothetical protein
MCAVYSDNQVQRMDEALERLLILAAFTELMILQCDNTLKELN